MDGLTYKTKTSEGDRNQALGPSVSFVRNRGKKMSWCETPKHESWNFEKVVAPIPRHQSPQVKCGAQISDSDLGLGLLPTVLPLG